MPLDRISFTTFNLLNLQVAGARMNRGQRPWTSAEVEAKVAWTAAMLGRAQADVLGFQELWSREPLEDALARSGLGASHELLVPPGHAGDRIVCAAAVPRGALAGPPEWIDRFPEDLVLRTVGDPDDWNSGDLELVRNHQPPAVAAIPLPSLAESAQRLAEINQKWTADSSWSGVEYRAVPVVDFP